VSRVSSDSSLSPKKLLVGQEKFLRAGSLGRGMREAAKNERFALLKSRHWSGDGGQIAGQNCRKVRKIAGDSKDGACQGGSNMSFLQMRRRNLERERKARRAASESQGGFGQQ
jgi:hypothetical protein